MEKQAAIQPPASNSKIIGRATPEALTDGLSLANNHTVEYYSTMNDINKDIRWLQRFQNLERAFEEFSSACAQAQYSKLERSGLIHTFEFTYELAWKTLQDLLLSCGYDGILGPRPVIEQAFHDGIIEDGETWVKMLISRNLTVHTYNEKTAEELSGLIKTMYYPSIAKLVQTLSDQRASINATRNI
jgi:nucleotidyltransferase substrate binding protein (TIGR01987 family)